MSNKSVAQRRKIYDLWHKENYQTNIKKFKNRAKKLHDELIIKLELNTDSKKTLLDVACGKGIFLSLIESEYKNVILYGTDISGYAINQAKKIVKSANLECSDGEKLPYKNNFFDYCTCLGGLEYYDNPFNGAKEISRVMKKNGKVVIFVPNLMFLGYIWLAFKNGSMPTHGGSKNNKIYYDYSDEKFYTYKGWKNVIENSGLKIISASSFNYLGSTKFLNTFLLNIYNKLLHKFIPFNLSYSFIFVCEKTNE